MARGRPRGPTLVRGGGPRTRETAGSDGRCQAAGGSGPWRRTPGSLAGGGRRLVRPPQPGSGLAKRRQPSKRIPPCYATGVGEDGPRPAKTSAPLQGVTSSGPARGRRREAGGGGKGSALGGQPGPSATPTPRGHGETFHGLLPSPARLGAPTKPCELGRGVVGRRHAQGALETRPLGSRVGRPAGPAVSYTTGCHEKLTVLSIRCRLGFGEGKDPPGVPQSCQSPKDELKQRVRPAAAGGALSERMTAKAQGRGTDKREHVVPVPGPIYVEGAPPSGRRSSGIESCRSRWRRCPLGAEGGWERRKPGTPHSPPRRLEAG